MSVILMNEQSTGNINLFTSFLKSMYLEFGDDKCLSRLLCKSNHLK